MVSFSCESCGDIFTKKKLDPHRNRCRGATFTCIDCMVHFPGTEYRWHTSCVSEEQKYQGALFKGKKAQQTPAPAPAQPAQPAHNAMAHPAYVEEVAEDYDSWRDYEQRSDDDSRSVNLPEAPTPPSAVEVDNVNVFDFLIDNPTPAASTLALPATAHSPIDETQLVAFDPETNDIENFDMNDGALVHFETGAVPVNSFETPAPKSQRKKIKDTDTVKKDKKRKRLHIETDQIMTDAPPVMHSGLTGGLNRMMRPSVFPPSPGDSGDNIATPASPLKKSKSKHHKSSARSTTETLGNTLMSMISGSKPKSPKPSKKKAKTSSSSTKKKSSSSSNNNNTSSSKHLEAPKEQKLLEYRPGSKDGKEAADASALVVYKPAPDHFLSLVNKGPDSERGCSVNKALKRLHRERVAQGVSVDKVMEEKELFKSLRMKKNDRGEIVLFVI